MFRVSVRPRSGSGKGGVIEFDGVTVCKPDGSMMMPVNIGNPPITPRVSLTPRGFVSEEIVQQILQDLATGLMTGSVGDYKWEVTKWF
jgi:hypothetical protein